MEFTTRPVTTQVEFVTMFGIEFIAREVLRILEEFECGGFDTFVIYDKRLTDCLRELEVVVGPTSKGGYIRGPNADSYCIKFRDEFYKYLGV